LDKLHCIGFEIDPSKQGLDEKLQIEYFQLKYNTKIEKLPSTGKKALCISKSYQIVAPAGLNFKIGERTKTFDAMSKTLDDEKTYYSIKYTNESGGAQDNQLKDIETFLSFSNEYLRRNPDGKIKFSVILSGEYMKTFYEEIKKQTFDKRITIYNL